MLKQVGARNEVITCRGWGLGGFLLGNAGTGGGKGWGLGGFLLGNAETGGGKERGNYQ